MGQLGRLALSRAAAPGGRDGWWVALGLLGLTVSMLWPGLVAGSDAFIGDPQTDVIRGLWGLSVTARSAMPPNALLFTREMNFPFGGWALILPWTSSVLLAPLQPVLGPIIAWNVANVLWLWGTAFGAAALVRRRSGSWAAGLVAGGALIGQPMVLQALADGTPEHLNWGPALICLWAIEGLIATPSARWAAGVALLGGAVALDSPYQAVFVAILAIPRLPALLGALGGAAPRRAAQTLLAGILATGLVGLALWALFSQFTTRVGAASDIVGDRQGNAVSLARWWRFEAGLFSTRDVSLVPTAIPVRMLVPALALAALDLRRAWGALIAAVVLLSLALGQGIDQAPALRSWWGATGEAVAAGSAWINDVLYDIPGPSIIRFPRRALVPTAVAVLVAGGLGWGRIEGWLRWKLGPSRWFQRAALVLGLGLSVLGSLAGRQLVRFDESFPLTRPPKLPFAEWIREHEVSGAVALLPEQRASRAFTERHALPVFAELGDALRSADHLYIQVVHGQPQVSFPQLLTFAPRSRTPRARGLLEDWNSLSYPATVGVPATPGAVNESDDARRAPGLKLMIDEGLRFLVLDAALYGETERVIMRRHLQGHIQEERYFEDGSGVLVIVLKP